MKKYLTLILLCSCAGILYAQSWSVQLLHPSQPYIYSEDLWHCYVTNPDTTSQEITLYCWVIHDGEEIAHGRSNPITVNPGRNHITSRDISDVSDEYYVDPYEDILERRGALPAGSYTFCVSVENAETQYVFASVCRDYAARGTGVLRLISPMDDAIVNVGNPTFIWAPLSPAGSIDHYSIKIVQVPEDMCADEAMSSAEPWHEDDDINTTNFRYPLSARTLRDEENYAWQVKAFGESDIVIGTSDIWDIAIGTPGTEPDDSCECGEWDSLTVSWDDTTAFITTPCSWPNTDTIWVDTGALVTVNGNYSCIPDDPNTCNDTYYWHWQLDGPPYTSGGGTVDELDVIITIDSTGCYNVEILPYCGEMRCDTCSFVICSCDIPGDTCECGGWESLVVEMKGVGNYSIDCPNAPDTIQFGTIALGTEITIVPDYTCEGDPDSCAVTYEGTVIPPAGTSPIQLTSYDYTLTETGCYQFEIIPICGDYFCDTCSFAVCCEIIPGDSCECGGWGESLEIEVNGTTHTINCSGFEETAPLYITCPSFPITITPNYVCDPVSCPVSYTGTIIPPVLTGPPISISSFTGSCTHSSLSGPGCYDFKIFAWCDGDLCDTCTFVICCDSIPGECECGGWGESLEVQVNDLVHFIDCSIGQDTIPLLGLSSTPVTITPNYICDPASCPVSYTGTIIPPVLTGPPIPVSSFTGSYTHSSLSGPGCYDFEIYAWCGTVACDTCRFTICCSETCECGGWESLNVTWNNQTQSLIPPSFGNTRETHGFHPNQEIAPDTIHIFTGTSVTVNGSYFCLPESYCCPDSYEWEIREYKLEGTAAGTLITHSTGSLICLFTFTIENDNCYQVSIIPYCNDRVCERDAYGFIVCGEDNPAHTSSPTQR